MIAIRSPVAASHSRQVLSELAVAMTSLVGEKAADQTPPVWPVWVWVQVPSVENTTVLMGPVCPVRVRSRVPV